LSVRNKPARIAAAEIKAELSDYLQIASRADWFATLALGLPTFNQVSQMGSSLTRTVHLTHVPIELSQCGFLSLIAEA